MDNETSSRQKTSRRQITIAIVITSLIILTPCAMAIYGRFAEGSWPDWTGFGQYNYDDD